MPRRGESPSLCWLARPRAHAQRSAAAAEREDARGPELFTDQLDVTVARKQAGVANLLYIYSVVCATPRAHSNHIDSKSSQQAAWRGERGLSSKCRRSSHAISSLLQSLWRSGVLLHETKPQRPHPITCKAAVDRRGVLLSLVGAAVVLALAWQAHSWRPSRSRTSASSARRPTSPRRRTTPAAA